MEVKPMTEQILKTSNGSVWIQPNGPNTEAVYLGQCMDADDIVEPNGGIELIQCFRTDMKGWDTMGTKMSPPDKVTFSLTELKMSVRSELMRMNCTGAVYILQRTCTEPTMTNWVNALVIRNSRITNKTRSNVVHHTEDNESTNKVDFEATPPVNEHGVLSVGRLVTAETQALNAIVADPFNCYGGCGDASYDGQLLWAGADSAAGPATANILTSVDGGATWAALAADPFGAGLHVGALARFTLNANVTRLLAAKIAVGAAQGLVAYSDDNGATWTQVNIGGVAAGHGVMDAHGLYVLNERLILLVSALGYIYRSIDGGVSWTAVEAGAITVGNYFAVHMVDDNYGIAGAAADVIAVTRDGGETWEAVTATGGGGDILAVQLLDRNRAWISTDDGEMWYSSDLGTTWAERTGFAGSGVGTIRSFHFYDEYAGFMAKNSAAPLCAVLQTIDGGYTWKPLVTPTNTGINHIRAVNPNLAFAVGEVEGGTAVILKISD